MIAAAVACTAAAGVIAGARRTGWGWCGPMNLYVLVWTAAVVLYTLKLFPFYDLLPATWLLIGLGGCAFVASCFAGGRVAGRARGETVRGPDDRAVRAVIRAFFLVGLLGSAIYLWHVHQTMGLRALAGSAGAVHTALTRRSISSWHLFLYYVGIAATILFAHRVIALRRRAAPIDWILLALFIMAMGVSTERTHMMWCLTCAAFCWLLPPRGDRSLARMLGGGLVVVVVAVPFYLALGRWLQKSPEELSRALLIVATAQTQPVPVAPRDEAEQLAYEARARARFATTAPMAQMRSVYVPAAAGWQPPEAVRQRLHALLPGGWLYRFSALYVSVAATLPALDQAVRIGDRTYGALTFHAIWRVLERFRILPQTQQTVFEEALTPFPHNVYTYLYDPFLDFGWIGALGFAALFGLAAGYAYRRAATGPESVWPLLLVQLQAITVWSAFQNRLVATPNLYLLVLVAVAHQSGRLVERYSTHSRHAAAAGDSL